jgi:hypothetical protein
MEGQQRADARRFPNSMPSRSREDVRPSGIGRMTSWLAREFGFVEAVDVSPENSS